jgi:rare lipoprotein A
MPRFARPLVVLLLLGLAGCATLGGRPRPGDDSAEVGTASFYARRFHGRTTASGVRYDPAKMLAAHRTLPFGTRVRVTNLENHRSVVVTVVDRGPFKRGRVIDLSRGAARELGFVREGLATVRLEVIEP